VYEYNDATFSEEFNMTMMDTDYELETIELNTTLDVDFDSEQMQLLNVTLDDNDDDGGAIITTEDGDKDEDGDAVMMDILLDPANMMDDDDDRPPEVVPDQFISSGAPMNANPVDATLEINPADIQKEEEEGDDNDGEDDDDAISLFTMLWDDGIFNVPPADDGKKVKAQDSKLEIKLSSEDGQQ